MTHLQVTGGYIVRFDAGEHIIRELTQFCEQQNVLSAWVSGLGGAAWAELAFYHLDQKAYEFDRINEPLEIAYIGGNITSVNSKPFVHLHATVADMNYHSYAGHVKEIEVGATAELFIQVFPESVTRVHNEVCGLKVLDLE